MNSGGLGFSTDESAGVRGYKLTQLATDSDEMDEKHVDTLPTATSASKLPGITELCTTHHPPDAFQRVAMLISAAQHSPPASIVESVMDAAGDQAHASESGGVHGLILDVGQALNEFLAQFPYVGPVFHALAAVGEALKTVHQNRQKAEELSQLAIACVITLAGSVTSEAVPRSERSQPWINIITKVLSDVARYLGTINTSGTVYLMIKSKKHAQTFDSLQRRLMSCLTGLCVASIQDWGHATRASIDRVESSLRGVISGRNRACAIQIDSMSANDRCRALRQYVKVGAIDDILMRFCLFCLQNALAFVFF